MLHLRSAIVMQAAQIHAENGHIGEGSMDVPNVAKRPSAHMRS